MVSPKRLENRFHGYQVPVVPRASRSARGRVPLKKKSESNQIEAFEILARVAGKFLLENDSTVPTHAADKNDLDCIFGIKLKSKQEDEGWLSKEEACEQGSSNQNTVAYNHQSYRSNKIFSVDENISLRIGNLQSKSCEFSGRSCLAETSKRSAGESSRHGDHFERKAHESINGFHIKKADELQNATKLNSEDIVKSAQKAVQVISSGNCRNLPFVHDQMNLNSFHGKSAGGKLGSRDNDEKFGGYTSSRSTNGGIGQLSEMEDHEVTAVSAYEKYRLDTNLKHSSSNSPLTYDNQNGMDNFSYERMQRLYPFKKRKFFKKLSPSPDEECQYGVSTSDNKFNGENPSAVGAVEASHFAVQKVCHKSKDCNVKLSIKSFRVPELFIEIPETATIGSLKRTVMEAVSSILRDEIHVGILFQGKKVRDDSKTLVQTGIAQDDMKNRLGFMLEPRHTQAYPPSYNGRTSLISSGLPKQYSKQSASLALEPGSFSAPTDLQTIKSESAEGDCNVVPLSASSSADKTMSKCRALVAVPSINMETLAVVPYTQKSGNPEFAQRRIRRPFSVSEVEALVQAVEKLGTGRWRDVKVCAFDNVKHRTYVDLKDKWKTLVHTARISPQQRRGEPVPQQLLDRVLAAHAYWSQQSRQQRKSL